MSRGAGARAGLVLAGLIALAGCGRQGPLEPPPDADPEFPRQYPAPQEHEDV